MIQNMANGEFRGMVDSANTDVMLSKAKHLELEILRSLRRPQNDSAVSRVTVRWEC